MTTEIETLEKEQLSITQELSNASIYVDNPNKAKHFQERAVEIQKRLDVLMSKWEILMAN
jgi:hypothetical protein